MFCYVAFQASVSLLAYSERDKKSNAVIILINADKPVKAVILIVSDSVIILFV